VTALFHGLHPQLSATLHWNEVSLKVGEMEFGFRTSV